jgi:hypothetical protein
MIGLIWFVLAVLAAPFKSKVRSHNHPARGAGALAQDRFSLSLALEITGTGRAATDRHGARRIQRTSVENPLWGTARVHGGLLKLRSEIAQSSVAKYMVKRRGHPARHRGL